MQIVTGISYCKAYMNNTILFPVHLANSKIVADRNFEALLCECLGEFR